MMLIFWYNFFELERVKIFKGEKGDEEIVTVRR